MCGGCAVNSSQRARWLVPSPSMAVDGGPPQRVPWYRPEQPGSSRERGENVRIVTQTADRAWRVHAPGCAKASAVCETRREAVARASEILRNCGGGRVCVYAPDESLIESQTVDAAAPSPTRRGTYRNPRGSFSF
jgi:hypothetical protein